MDANFQRAAELVNVPDDIILDMYNKLRPNRSTRRTDSDGAGTSSEIQRSSLRQTGT